MSIANFLCAESISKTTLHETIVSVITIAIKDAVQIEVFIFQYHSVVKPIYVHLKPSWLRQKLVSRRAIQTGLTLIAT
jgi:hypothetical protein